jgi:hypothetical protein
MNFSGDGLSLWYGTSDAPAPPDAVARTTRASLTVAARPASTSNVVDLRYRVDRGFTQTLAATDVRTDYDRDIQYFRVSFPRFPSGDTVEYCPVLTCSGRQVPTASIAERFPSHFRLEDPVALAPLAPESARPMGQRYSPDLEFLSSLTIRFDKPQVIGDTPEGLRINYYALDGTARGPRINGKVLPASSDSLIIRPDGIGVVRVRATLETDDGALISVEYLGSLELGEGGYEKALLNQFPPSPTVVLAPRAVTSHSKYAWLNRLQCIGVGRVLMDRLTLEYDLFGVTVHRLGRTA